MAHEPSREYLIATLDQIPPGEGRNFLVGGVEIAVFRTHDGTVHATQPRCPHLDGPLADGLLGGKTVMCPLHDRTYDLVTGCGLTHEQAQLQTYPARLDQSNNIWVEPSPNAALAGSA